MAYHISDKSTVLFTVVQRNRTNKEQIEIDIIWIQIYEREKRERFVMEIGSHSYEGGKFPKSAVCKLEKYPGAAQTESKNQITRGVDGVSSHKPGF